MEQEKPVYTTLHVAAALKVGIGAVDGSLDKDYVFEKYEEVRTAFAQLTQICAEEMKFALIL